MIGKKPHIKKMGILWVCSMSGCVYFGVGYSPFQAYAGLAEIITPP